MRTACLMGGELIKEMLVLTHRASFAALRSEHSHPVALVGALDIGIAISPCEMMATSMANAPLALNGRDSVPCILLLSER